MTGKPHKIGPLGLAVAENVKRLRAEQKLTRAELSEKLKAVGVHLAPLPSIKQIEERNRRIDVDELVGLAAVFGMTPEMLMDKQSASEYRQACLRWLLAEAEWEAETSGDDA